MPGCVSDSSEPASPDAVSIGTERPNPEPVPLEEVRPFSTDAADGTTLRGHVYLPASEEPYATVLVFLPYWNHGGGVGSDEMDTTEDGRSTMIERFGLQALMDHGFAVALVNVRGTGISDGCYSYMNHPANGPDANAVVDALANRSWSNGRVGMFGLSYGGATQYAALAHDPSPHLDAVVPVSGEWDEWNLLGRWGAAVESAFGSHPLRRDAMQGMGLAGTRLSPGQFQPTPEHACEDTVRDLQAYEELKVHGDKTPFYEVRDLRDGLREARVPIFATNGMTEEEGHILQFEGLWEMIPHGDKRLMVGQWGHGFPYGDADRFTREHAIPWLDHFLRDGPPVETGVVTYQDGTGTWHNSTSWPPAEVHPESLHLSGTDLVQTSDDVERDRQRFVADDEAIPRPGDCPATAAVFASPSLEKDVSIAGNARVNATLTSSHPDENLAAYLWTAEDPPSCDPAVLDGSSVDATRHGYALSDLRHRGHLEKGRPFPVDAPETVQLRTMPLADVLPAGHRIVLTVGGGHPELFPDPGTAALTVETGPSLEGTLTLPVTEGSVAFEAPG